MTENLERHSLSQGILLIKKISNLSVIYIDAKPPEKMSMARRHH
jgi:hypothetical protein